MSSVLAKFYERIAQGQVVYAFGAGLQGEIFVKLTKQYRPDLQIKGFIDNNKTGTVESLPVMSLHEYITQKDKEGVVIITSSFRNEIIGQLASQGVDNFMVLDLFAPYAHFDPKSEKHFREYLVHAVQLAEKGHYPYQNVTFTYRNDVGEEVSGEHMHPESPHDYQCAFFAKCLREIRPDKILDIGSFRYFILGLLAHYDVTSVDIRKRSEIMPQETVINGDACNLDLPDNSFDTMMTVCSIHSFGMGIYSHDFDVDADYRAMEEFRRVIKPGGNFLFSLPVSKIPWFRWNFGRSYSLDMIRNLTKGFTPVREEYVIMRNNVMNAENSFLNSISTNMMGTWDNVTDEENAYDYYLGWMTLDK